MSNKLNKKVKVKPIVVNDLPDTTINNIAAAINEVNACAELSRTANENHIKANRTAETLLFSIMAMKGYTEKQLTGARFEIQGKKLVCTLST